MALSRRHKIIIISLVIYWPLLFILAHVPIPQAVRKSGVSDKSLHFIAYLILVFLFWFAVNPDKKFNWRRVTSWWILLMIVLYGICDEWLQGCMGGRSADIRDLFADLAGVAVGLFVLSFFSFWPTALFVTAATIFFLTNFSGANVLAILPLVNTAFHLLAFAFLTMLWIQCTNHTPAAKGAAAKWLVVALLGSSGFLGVVKVTTLFTHKTFSIIDTVVSLIGIVAVVITFFTIALFGQKHTKPQEATHAEA